MMLFNELSPHLNIYWKAVRVWVSKMPRERRLDFRRQRSDTEDRWANSVDDLPRFSKEWNAEKE
jgi:hypothetical protein